MTVSVEGRVAKTSVREALERFWVPCILASSKLRHLRAGNNSPAESIGCEGNHLDLESFLVQLDIYRAQVARTIKISAGTDSVGGRMAGSGERGILVAHGAGTNQDHPTIVATRDGLAAGGFTVLTFNYAYSQAGRSAPDNKERLLRVHRAALERLVERAPASQTLAGRSMGGRMGTYLAAEGVAVDSLVLYGYPLHPPGQPDKLRADHLLAITAPMLFFQGGRDALSRSELFDRYVRTLPTVTVIDLPLDHSLGGLKGVERLVEGTLSYLS